MSRSPRFQVLWCCMLAAGVTVLPGCEAPTDAGIDPAFAKAASSTGPSVTAADPSFGHEGEVQKQVTITGKGFVDGATPQWEKDGLAYPGIQVVSTQFVSSTQLVATINIAASAAIDIYDISVTNPDRKKGIGYSLFQVTQAIAVTGTTYLRNVNSNGEMVGVLTQSTGNLAYYYGLGTGLVQLYNNGAGWAIDEAGKTIAGNTAGSESLPIPLWNLSGGSWIQSALPVDPRADGGLARVMASDATGTAIYIAGGETVPAPKRGSLPGELPVIWRRNLSGAWEGVLLPVLPSSLRGEAMAVTPSGVAVGNSSGQGVVWTPDGSGGYSVATLPGPATAANGITSAGDLVVGVVNGLVVYWQRLPAGGWSGAQSLPIACSQAVDVDDAGRIVANNCQKSARVKLSAVFTPPYATTPPIWLGGLDPSANPIVWGMSPQNGWISGNANITGNRIIGAYWKLP